MKRKIAVSLWAAWPDSDISWILIVLAHWNNSLRVDMSLHPDTLFRFRANQCLLLLLLLLRA